MEKKNLPHLYAEVKRVGGAGTHLTYEVSLRDAHKVYLRSGELNGDKTIANTWASQHMPDARELQFKYFSRSTINVATLQLPSITPTEEH